MHPIFKFIHLILEIYSFLVFVYIIMFYLVQFRVINIGNNFVRTIFQTLADIIEPVLNKIRRYVKPIGNADLSPLILLVTIYMLQYTIAYYAG